MWKRLHKRRSTTVVALGFGLSQAQNEGIDKDDYRGGEGGDESQAEGDDDGQEIIVAELGFGGIPVSTSTPTQQQQQQQQQTKRSSIGSISNKMALVLPLDLNGIPEAKQ